MAENMVTILDLTEVTTLNNTNLSYLINTNEDIIWLQN